MPFADEQWLIRTIKTQPFQKTWTDVRRKTLFEFSVRACESATVTLSLEPNNNNSVLHTIYIGVDGNMKTRWEATGRQGGGSYTNEAQTPGKIKE